MPPIGDDQTRKINFRLIHYIQTSKIPFFRGFYLACVNTDESLTTQMKPEKLKMKFVSDSLPFTLNKIHA